MGLIEMFKNAVKSKPILASVIILLIGFLVGWWLMGYVVWPVQYVGQARTSELSTAEKEQYLMMAADSYQVTGNAMEARSRLYGWDNREISILIGNVAANLRNQGRTADAKRVEDLGGALGTSPGIVPTAIRPASGAAPSKPAPFSIMSLIKICIGFVVIFIAIAAILFIVDLRKRKAKGVTPRAAVEKAAQPAVKGELAEPAMGRFASTYTLGDDNYDESFTIETAAGEFLGECGVGISETIESGPPDRVTAFEVWLFDKSDIRTVTKVLMSEFAFNESAIRDKLAPKGDAVLAKPGQVIRLETASLAMEARITDLKYGAEGQYRNSYFDTLTLELMAGPQENPA